jgi:DNA-binding MarR family transcriptional regulator
MEGKLARSTVLLYAVTPVPRKTLDASVTEFSDSVGLLLRRLRAASASQELSWTESAVIARLANDGPATTADLARAEGIKPQSMGTTIAALEEMGIVERKPHPTDGRQVYIALTTKGAAVRKSGKDARRAWLMQAVLQLDERERETLFKAGEIIQRIAEGRIAEGHIAERRIANGRVAETRLVEK